MCKFGMCRKILIKIILWIRFICYIWKFCNMLQETQFIFIKDKLRKGKQTHYNPVSFQSVGLNRNIAWTGRVKMDRISSGGYN